MAFTLPKLPKFPRAKGKRRRAPSPAAHRPAEGRPHPVVPPGGSSRTAHYRPRDEPRHSRGSSSPRTAPAPAQRPVAAPAPPAPVHRGTRTRPDLMGQPKSGKGNPRARFGPPDHVRVTDMAPAYRAQGQRARTPKEQREHELSRDALINATKAAARERRAATGRGAAEHEPPGRARSKPTGGSTYQSRNATRATGSAARPAARLPGDAGSVDQRQRARAAGRKGSEYRQPSADPERNPGHPFFSGGLRAAPQTRSWRDAT